MTINEIEDFASKMQSLGDDYGVSPLSDWATDLSSAVEMFDKDKVDASLGAYGDLIAALQKE